MDVIQQGKEDAAVTKIVHQKHFQALEAYKQSQTKPIHQNETLLALFEQSSHISLNNETYTQFYRLKAEFEFIKDFEEKQNRTIDLFLAESFLQQVEELRQTIRLTNQHSISLVANTEMLLAFVMQAGRGFNRNPEYWIPLLKLTYIFMFFFKIPPHEIAQMTFQDVEIIVEKIEQDKWKNIAIQSLFAIKEQDKKKNREMVLFFSLDTFSRTLAKDINLTAFTYFSNQQFNVKSFLK